jgi:hypothetical protein
MLCKTYQTGKSWSQKRVEGEGRGAGYTTSGGGEACKRTCQGGRGIRWGQRIDNASAFQATYYAHRYKESKRKAGHHIIAISRFNLEGFSNNNPSSPVSSRLGTFCGTSQYRNKIVSEQSRTETKSRLAKGAWLQSVRRISKTGKRHAYYLRFVPQLIANEKTEEDGQIDV